MKGVPTGRGRLSLFTNMEGSNLSPNFSIIVRPVSYTHLESACEDFFCHEPKFDFFDTYGVCNDLGDADVVNTIWYLIEQFFADKLVSLPFSVTVTESLFRTHASGKVEPIACLLYTS